MAEQHLIPFLYQGAHLVRVLAGPDGQPWFVAADACRILGLRNVSRALEGLDKDEKGMSNSHTPGGVQELLTVCEGGLYTLIIRSRRPEANSFRRWITHEVLPSIRRTGGYRMMGARQQKSASKEWVDKVNATCRAVDAIRRSHGPRAAAAVSAEMFAGIGIDLPPVQEPEFDLKVVGGTDTEKER